MKLREQAAVRYIMMIFLIRILVKDQKVVIVILVFFQIFVMLPVKESVRMLNVREVILDVDGYGWAVVMGDVQVRSCRECLFNLKM